MTSVILGVKKRWKGFLVDIQYLHWGPHISQRLSGWWAPACHDGGITRRNRNLLTVLWTGAGHPHSMSETESSLTGRRAGGCLVIASNCCWSCRRWWEWLLVLSRQMSHYPGKKYKRGGGNNKQSSCFPHSGSLNTMLLSQQHDHYVMHFSDCNYIKTHPHEYNLEYRKFLRLEHSHN